MWKKGEELDVCVQLQGYNLTETTETPQENSQNWNAAVDRYGLSQNDKPGWQGAGAVLYVTVQ